MTAAAPARRTLFVCLLFLCLSLLPLQAAYTYLISDPFSSISGAWTANGTISGSADGLRSSSANGGSVIYNTAFTPEYEVKATLRIVASGGTFVLYSRATANALSGPAAQGSYYAVEFTPTLSGGGCTMCGELLQTRQ